VIRGLAGRGRAVMAAHARADHLRVVDAQRRREAYRRMAVFAEIRGRDVLGRLARGADTVVAARARVGDAGVIEMDRRPPRRPVAGVALGSRRRMLRRLADALDVVVAARAGATDDGVVVHPRDRQPRRRAMAVLAEVRRQRMLRRARARADPPAFGVAADAFERRALKHARDVARLAIDRAVRTV